MNVTLTPTHVNVELTAYEKIGGLSGDVSIPRADITAARVDREPLRSIRGKLKVGLRIPGRLFVCRTDLGRHFWAVKRGVPGLHLALAGTGRRREITVSAAEAERLAREINGGG